MRKPVYGKFLGLTPKGKGLVAVFNLLNDPLSEGVEWDLERLPNYSKITLEHLVEDPCLHPSDKKLMGEALEALKVFVR